MVAVRSGASPRPGGRRQIRTDFLDRWLMGGVRGNGPRQCTPAGAGPVRGCVRWLCRVLDGDGHRPRGYPPSPAIGPRPEFNWKRKNPGDDLFSRKAALSVSSALESLTSVFGMGTGMASPLESPGSHAIWTWSAAARSGSRDTGTRRAPEEIFDLVMGEGLDRRSRSQPLTPGQLLKRSSPRPLVPLSFIRHRTSTCGLSNRWSPCGLTRLTRWGTSSRGELRT
jgi:hypothetical protein